MSARHWTADEFTRLMHERGLDIRGLAVLAGVKPDLIRDFFAGKCLPTIVNLEKIAGALGHEFDILSDGTPNPARDCPFCGKPVIPVRVHGHEQCPKCQAILARCCDD